MKEVVCLDQKLPQTEAVHSSQAYICIFIDWFWFENMKQKYRIMQVRCLPEVVPITGGSPASTPRWHIQVPAQGHAAKRRYCKHPRVLSAFPHKPKIIRFHQIREGPNPILMNWSKLLPSLSCWIVHVNHVLLIDICFVQNKLQEQLPHRVSHPGGRTSHAHFLLHREMHGL